MLRPPPDPFATGRDTRVTSPTSAPRSSYSRTGRGRGRIPGFRSTRGRPADPASASSPERRSSRSTRTTWSATSSPTSLRVFSSGRAGGISTGPLTSNASSTRTGGRKYGDSRRPPWTSGTRPTGGRRARRSLEHGRSGTDAVAGGAMAAGVRAREMMEVPIGRGPSADRGQGPAGRRHASPGPTRPDRYPDRARYRLRAGTDRPLPEFAGLMRDSHLRS